MKEMPAVDAKTLDQILDTVDIAVLLKRFDAVRKTANAVDAERDRLRKYIQARVPAARYEDVMLTFKDAGTRQYANSAGLSALQTAVIVVATSAQEREVAFGDEVTVRNKAGEIVYRGTLVDNEQLYTESETRNIQIVVIPKFD
jgi:transcription elongation GreA/GreB family factor